jgi:hypothetical protein
MEMRQYFMKKKKVIRSGGASFATDRGDKKQRVKKPWSGKLKNKNFWIGGIAGMGKSHWAANMPSAEEQYRKNPNKWWDGDRTDDGSHY